MATAKHSSEQFIGEAQIIERRVENRGFLGVFEGSRGFGLRQRAEKERFETSEDVFDGFFPRKNFARRETESMDPQSRGTSGGNFGEFPLLPLGSDSLRFEAFRIR